MGKIKSAEEKLKEKGIISESIEFSCDWYEKHIEEEEVAAKAAQLKEENRIKELKCPLCYSTHKEHIIKSESNGIIGPGYSSWILDEYFVCKNCGIMYKDISK